LSREEDGGRKLQKAHTLAGSEALPDQKRELHALFQKSIGIFRSLAILLGTQWV